MGRPPLEPGSWGAIHFTHRPDGKVRARGRFRDAAGVYRFVEATAATAAEAEVLLRGRVRSSRRSGHTLTQDSTIKELAEWWLAGISSRRDLQPGTLENYKLDSRHVVTALGGVRLRELDIQLVDEVILQLAVDAPTNARRVRVMLRRMVADAVRVEVMTSNPVDAVPAPRLPPPRPYSLDTVQLNALRDEFRDWHATRSKPGPAPDPRVIDMLDIMLFVGIRIGEVLALRTRDVTVEPKPSLRISATLVDGSRGEPVWQDHPKSGRQRRDIQLSDVALSAITPHLRPSRPDAPLFPNRDGSWLRVGSVRRILHSFRSERAEALHALGIEAARFTPHLLRRSLATLVASELGVDRAKEQLGHASVQTTERHYVTPPLSVGSEAAALVDRIFGGGGDVT